MLIGVAVGAVLLAASALPVVAADEVFLVSGGRLTGDLQDTDFTLQTPRGAYRVTRDNVWRLGLSTGSVGDVVDLRNGSRISGRLDRPGYTLRLPGGESRRLTRGEVAVIKLGAPGGGARAGRLTDVLILKDGDVIYGEVTGKEFDVSLSSGTQRFNRDSLWRIWLDSASGDGVALANGDRLDGVVEQAGYEIRTGDGQTLAFRRDEVKEILLRGPEKPKAAATAPGAAPSGPAAPPTVPPTALPPAVRAVLSDLHFEFDRWDLTPEARKTLEEVADALKAYPSLNLLIEGHADERGTVEYNLALGARRAQAAKDYLVGLGIDVARLDTISYGEERPFDPGHNEVAWALNRRAHFAVKQ